MILEDEKMSRKSYINWILRNSTKVYDKGDVSVHANISVDGLTLKETVGIRVVKGGAMSKSVVVDMSEGKDHTKVLRGIMGAGGLNYRDIENVGVNVTREYNKIKRIREEDNYGIADILSDFYEMMLERCITRDERVKVDPNLDVSVLVDKGEYRMKTGVLESMAKELGVEYTLIKSELQKDGLMYKGVKRDDQGKSLDGIKFRLLAIDQQAMDEAFGSDEEADQEETASA